MFYQVAIILTLTTQPSDSIPRNLPERNENICLPKDLYRNVYCIFIANIPIFINTAKKGKRPEDPRKGFESLHKREGTKKETVLDQGLKRK